MRYYKTKYNGIRITKTGVVKNTISGKVLKIYKRGSFMFNKKHINLAKYTTVFILRIISILMMLTGFWGIASFIMKQL